MYRGKDCMETFIEHIEYEVKPLCAKFPQKPMTEIPDML